MEEPRIGHEYHFVRCIGNSVERAVFERFHDGGAVVTRDGAAKIFEHDPQAWLAGWQELCQLGFTLTEETIGRAQGAP